MITIMTIISVTGLLYPMPPRAHTSRPTFVIVPMRDWPWQPALAALVALSGSALNKIQ